MEEKSNFLILEEIASQVKIVNQRLTSSSTDLQSASSESKLELQEENSRIQLQDTFNSTHDKLFNINSTLIAVVLVLANLERTKEFISFIYLIVPLLTLLYLVYMEYKQMDIHRFSAQISTTKFTDYGKLGKLICSQNMRSLSIITITSIEAVILIGALMTI